MLYTDKLLVLYNILMYITEDISRNESYTNVGEKYTQIFDINKFINNNTQVPSIYNPPNEEHETNTIENNDLLYMKSKIYDHILKE